MLQLVQSAGSVLTRPWFWLVAVVQVHSVLFPPLLERVYNFPIVKFLLLITCRTALAFSHSSVSCFDVAFVLLEQCQICVSFFP